MAASSSITLNTTHTNAGAYSDTWSFSGGNNYNDIASTSITDVIGKANATVLVTPYTVTYDANPHTASYSITGVGSDAAAVGSSITLNTTHTNAGAYGDSWSFSGGNNYYGIASTAISDVIGKANATVLVTPYTVTYDRTPHTASYSITGVGTDPAAAGSSISLNTTHTNAGAYGDTWSFSGGNNYNDIASTAITDTINTAALTIKANNDSKIYGTLKTFSTAALSRGRWSTGDSIIGVAETSVENADFSRGWDLFHRAERYRNEHRPEQLHHQLRRRHFDG